MPLYAGALQIAGYENFSNSAVIVSASSSKKADYFTDGLKDEVQIQAAIDAVSAAGGGEVFLREGDYSLSAPLTITTSGVTLHGAGYTTKLTLANGVNDHMLKITGTGVVRVQVKQLQLQGNSSHQTANSSSGIYISTPWDGNTGNKGDPKHVFEDIDIYDTAKYGIDIPGNDVRVLFFNRVRVRQSVNYAFNINSTDSFFVNCVADQGAQGGFLVNNYNNQLYNCFAFWCSSANSTGGGFHVSSDNNYFTTCESQNDYYDGFYITSNHNIFGNCISDSNGQNHTGRGFRILGSNNQIVGGGAFHYSYYPDWTQLIGISVEGGATGNTIANVLTYSNGTNYSDTSSGTNQKVNVAGDTGSAVVLSRSYTSTSGSNTGLAFTSTNAAASGTGSVIGIQASAKYNGSFSQSADANNAVTQGVFAYAQNTSGSTANFIKGIVSQVDNTGAGGILTASGIQAYVHTAGSGTITDAYGIRTDAWADAANITNWYGVYLTDGVSFGAQIATQHGIHINNMTGGTTNRGIYFVGTGTGNSIEWAGDTNIYRSAADTLKTDDTLVVAKAIVNGAEVDDGNSGTADTIDWTTGNRHKSTATGNCTYTFTAPGGAAELTLKIVNDGSVRTITWPGTVKWSGGTAPTLTGTNNKVDLIRFYYDGTSYYGSFNLNY